MSATAKPAKAGAGGIWMLGLATGIALALAPGAAALALVLLMPGVAAFLLDGGKGKPAARPVLLCGLATIVFPGVDWWQAGPDLGNALAIATRPDRLGLAWSLQGLAWLAIEVLPTLIRLVLDGTADARIVALRRARTHLEEEWNIPPSGRAE